VTPTPTPTPSRSRAPLIFAILGVLAALIIGGAYVYRDYLGRSQLTPEQTVDEFLTAVFTARNADRAAAVVCDGWDPEQAIRRTRAAIPDGANVSWDRIRLISADDDRAVVRATLGLRPFYDEEISDTVQWTFNLVDEKGWRVCEARPLT
jgi:hypothetical protein